GGKWPGRAHLGRAEAPGEIRFLQARALGENGDLAAHAAPVFPGRRQQAAGGNLLHEFFGHLMSLSDVRRNYDTGTGDVSVPRRKKGRSPREPRPHTLHTDTIA